MGLWKRLRLMVSRPRINDPEFGPLRFMYVPRAPENSYWEAEWRFPPVGYEVSISLPGSEDGPRPEGREFYLARAKDFDRVVEAFRPRLEQVIEDWLQRPLAAELWADVKLAGFDIEDLDATPVSWDVAFETVGSKWLGITVPFTGDVALEAAVDT